MAVCYNFKLCKVTVSVPSDEALQDEFKISTSTVTLNVRASNEDVRNDWIEEINEAIGHFTRTQLTYGKVATSSSSLSFAKQVCQDKTIEDIGDKEPVWFPKGMATFCQVETCKIEFGIFARKKRCHCCGAVVCSKCSQQQAPLQYNSLTRGKVCLFCFTALTRSKTN